MKNYFIYFEFYNLTIDRFFSGIVSIDLEMDLIEQCKGLIKQAHSDIDPERVTIAIKSFNNIS